MTCVRDGKLRALLDRELEGKERDRLQAHLGVCARCSGRLARLEQQAQAVRRRLADDGIVADPLAAWRQVVATLDTPLSSPHTRREWDMRLVMQKQWRSVLAGALAVVVLAGVFSFAPSRALARQLLSIFRVRKFAVVPVQVDQSRIEDMAKSLQGQVFLGEPTMTVNEPLQTATSLEEASKLAGFSVRAPTAIFAGQQPTITVKGRTELTFPLKREGLVMLLGMADMNPDLVPASLGDGLVTVSALAAAELHVGKYELVQVLDPSVQYPEGLDPKVMGEAVLRVLGVAASDAHRISQKWDWTSTVLLPVPTNLAEFQEVIVAGADGIVLRPRRDASGGQADYPALMWQKGNVVYLFSGPNTSEGLVKMATSMFGQ